MMVRSTAEQERPAEWLDALRDAGGYLALLEDAGSIGVAAHRLARALCRVRPMAMTLPTLNELEAAARTISEACALAVPSGRALLQTCDLAGLIVIEPLERTPLAPRVVLRTEADAAAYAY